MDSKELKDTHTRISDLSFRVPTYLPSCAGRASDGYFSPTPSVVRRPCSRLTDMSKEAAASAFSDGGGSANMGLEVRRPISPSCTSRHSYIVWINLTCVLFD